MKDTILIFCNDNNNEKISHKPQSGNTLNNVYDAFDYSEI
jgi:hypothetical protein